MNYENKIEKTDSLPIPINDDSTIIYSRDNKSRELVDLLLFNDIEIPVFHIAGQKVLALNHFGKIVFPNNPNSIYNVYYRNKVELENYILFFKMMNTIQNDEYYGNLTLFITFPGILKLLMLIKTPERSLIMDWIVNILSMKMLAKATSQPIVSQTTSITPIDSLTIANLENHQVRIRRAVEKLKVNDLFYSGEINYLHKKFEDVEREIKEIKSIKQFQINNQTETPTVPESGTIEKRERTTIQLIIRNIADIEGVHFNKICNEFKQAFSLRIYSDLSTTDYKNAIIWLNKRHDQAKEKATSFPTDSKLDAWFTQRFNDNLNFEIDNKEVVPN